MYSFSARSAVARASIAASWLVRVAAYAWPTLVSLQDGFGSALPFALACGLMDGLFRLQVGRNARSFVAEADALVIASGFSTLRIAWSKVTAIETWQQRNRVDLVAVHYEGDAGIAVATCWDQNHREECQAFVRRCAELVQTAGPRSSITRASLAERSVQLLLLRHLALDVAITLLAGILCGVVGQAIWLGLATATVSTSLAASVFLRSARLEAKDGLWWRRGNGEKLERLRVVPRSLRLWVDCLSQTVHG